MKKIRIKILTIIILVTLIMGISVLPTVFKGDILYFIGNIYESLGKEDIADTYYKKVIDSSDGDELSVKAAIKRLENVFSEKEIKYMKMVTFHEGWVTSGSFINRESLLKINEEHKKIANNIEKNDEVALYEIYVSMANWFAGETENAINIIENIDYIQDEELEIYREINNCAMKIVLGQYEEGEEIIYSSLRDNKFNKYKQSMLAFINFMKGEDYGEILKYKPESISYKDGKIVGTDNVKKRNIVRAGDTKYILSVFEDFIDAEWFMESNLVDKYTGNCVLKGNITYNGEPVRGAIVYLTEHSGLSSGGIFSDIEGDNCGFAVTDQNGEYIIENIRKGDYGLGMTIPWQIITGKVIKKNRDNSLVFNDNTVMEENFEIFDAPQITDIRYIDPDRIKVQWESNDELTQVSLIEAKGFVDNKDGEMIQAYNTGWNVVIDEQEKNYAIINIKKTLDNLNGRVWGWSSGVKINPYQLFEAFYIGGEYTFEVHFKNNNSEKYSYIGDETGGIYPNEELIRIDVKGEELTEGDKLLLEKNYEEAVKWFEKNLEKNPNDTHGLKILSAIYYGGYLMKHEDEEKFEGETLFVGQDFNKAQKYTERLVKLNENEMILTRLEQIYSELGMRDKAFEILEKLIENYNHFYYYKDISRYYIRKGDIKEGYKQIKLYHENEDGEYEEFSEIIMMAIILNDEKQLEKVIPVPNSRYSIDVSEELNYYLDVNKDKYQEFFNNINHNKFEEGKEIVKNDESDLGLLYRGLMILLMREGKYEEEYTALYKKQPDKKLKRIMKYFGQCEISSGFGNDRF